MRSALLCVETTPVGPCPNKTTSKTGRCTVHRAFVEQAQDEAERQRPALDTFQRVRVGKPYTRRERWEEFRFYPVRVMDDSERLVSAFDAVSVTTVLKHAVPKPALVHWAAKVERAFVLDTLEEVIDGMVRSGVKSRGAAGAFVRQLVTDRLGERYAHRMKLKAAGEIGTEIHRWIEWHHLRTMDRPHGDEPVLSDPAMNAVSAYLDLERGFDVRPIATEERLASPTLGVAGSLDTRAWARHPLLGDVRVIIDYKSGKEIYDEARQQIGAYALMHNELCRLHEHDDETTQAGLVFRLPKVVGDPLPEVEWLVDNLEHYGEKFVVSTGQYHSLWDEALS